LHFVPQSESSVHRRPSQGNFGAAAGFCCFAIGLLRAVRAVELLRNPDATTASAASALGYADPGNFVKDFRRVLGLAPNAFRTRLLRLDGA
jgi:AraC-like DNA-binding protein